MQAGSVHGDIHFHRGGSPGGHLGPTPRQLPADIRAFVNRTDELGRLDAILTDEDGSQVSVSVHVVAGTAGAGKTSLVLHWAHQVKHRFPGGQLFVNLRGYDPGEPVTAQQAVGGFLRALGVPAADVPSDAGDAAALYRSLLADRRVLILLDNAATANQVRPLLPGSGGSLVIVTSRDRLAGLAIRDGARRLTLGTLPEAEAVALLRAVTSGYRPRDDEQKLAELAHLCAGLPLALRIAAERAASQPHMRLDDLIADLRDESAVWDALSSGSDDEADAVRTVFAWSYRALPETAARLFRLLGLHPNPEFGPHAAAALADIPPRRARQLLDDLVGAHLVEQTAPDRYQLHDLLRAYATTQVRAEEPPEEQQAALRRVLHWYERTADAARKWLKPSEPEAPGEDPSTAVQPLVFTDYDAAADWSEHEHAAFPGLVRAATAAGLDLVAARLAEASWKALAPSAGVNDWLDSGREGVRAAQRSGDAGARLRLLIALGSACRTGGLFGEGLDALGKALELARAFDSRPEEARVLNFMGLIHLVTRRLDLAADAFGQAQVLFRAQGEPRSAATALSNLANTHLDAGRLDEAAIAVREALAAHRALDDRRGVGNALNIHAAIHLEQGSHDTARATIAEALDIALALRNHRQEGYWLLTCGDVHRTCGEYGEALVSYQRSATLHRRLANRSREALAWRGAGLTYAQTDRGEEAAAFHRRAAAVHRELRDAWELAVELGHLASAVHAEDPAAARDHWAEALTHLAPYPDPRARALRSRIEEHLAGHG